MELCSGEARMLRARSRLGMVWRSTRREGDLHQSQAEVAAKVDTKLKHKIFWVASTKIVQSGVVMRSL